MAELHEILAERVAGWRAAAYDHPSHAAIGEILLYARNEDASPRYLREPQIRALETYWYLRLVESTPRIGELYERLVDSTSDRLTALGLSDHKDVALDIGYDGLIERIRTDDAFVRTHRLEGLRETLTLDYPSYILALAMGAGKTILIGAIVATEFAMALEYPDADPPFVENALVFAPGKTIIESLRELSRIRFDDLLPPRLHAPFAASLKLTFTRDGEKDIPVTRGSRSDTVDAYGAASELAATYRLETWPLLDAIRVTYRDDAVPIAHLTALARQLEEQLGGYEETTSDEPAELSVLKPEGFELTAEGERQAAISYPADRQRLIWPPERIAENPAGYGFHYVPYNFDSVPESDFFEKVLRDLNLARDDVRDIYFTGAITDPKKTDLAFEYAGADGRCIGTRRTSPSTPRTTAGSWSKSR